MNKPNQLIIVGGGKSIQDGISLGLWDKLRDKFTIGLNYAYKFSEFTVISFVDIQFYNQEYNNLAKLPLILGTNYRTDKKNLPNTIYLTPTNKYSRDLSTGVYCPRLVGMLALTLGIYLLDVGEIFLLGYDMGSIIKDRDPKGREITHFYQDNIQHGGIGKTYYYNRKNAEEVDFGVYKQEKQVKIYNVSPQSNLNLFDKIDYPTFFQKISPELFIQEELRAFIRAKLKSKVI
jgi:hypothetical protein